MIFYSFVIAFILFVQLFHSNEAKWNFDEYKCVVCVPAMQYMIDHKDVNFQQACLHYFSESMCEKFKLDSQISLADIPRKSARELCQNMHMCSTKESYLGAAADVDVRVTRAIGSKGYNQARLSVISNTTISSPYFTYNSQFKYRWTNKYLNSGLVTLTPGQNNHFSIGGKTFDVYLPKENVGTRGVIIADPCITSQWIVCVYKDKYQTFDHYTTLLNTINQRNDISFWQVLGDNFYDQEGDASSSFFAALSDATKSKFLYTTPGNHDFWVNSSPTLSVPWDQYGNGLMQFYGQDTLGASATSPYDFSINPDGSYGRARGENIPPASNFFYYNKLGDIAFIGYSGAHTYDSMKSHFTEACSWAASVNPKVVILEGHWNEDGDGCDSSATVPEVYEELKAVPACAPIMSRMKYFMGHKHCNYVTQPNVGYMVGGAGMSDVSCNGDFGFTVLDTVDGNVNIYYFPVAHANDYDNYDSILSCIKSNGLPGCYHLAQKWN